MMDGIWRIVTTPFVQWKPERESHDLTDLCDLYVEDWKTGEHDLTELGDKDWANQNEIIKMVFYHFCGGKNLYDQLPSVNLDSDEHIFDLSDERNILRISVLDKDVGVKLNDDFLYFNNQGDLMVKIDGEDPEMMIRQYNPPRFNVEIRKYLSLHNRVFGGGDTHLKKGC